MSIVSRVHPKEFRADVVAVARRGDAPISQIAKDFGISDSCLRNWLHAADVEDGHRPGQSAAESAELRELKRRNRLLEQENEVLRRAAAYLSQASLPK
jgi:transposase-like protein